MTIYTLGFSFVYVISPPGQAKRLGLPPERPGNFPLHVMISGFRYGYLYLTAQAVTVKIAHFT
jgi:hypothetical protein